MQSPLRPPNRLRRPSGTTKPTSADEYQCWWAWVERSRIYANLLDDLSKVYREMVKGSDQGKRAVREQRQPRRVSHRLSREEVDRLVAEYRGGTPTPELCRRYSLGKSTVLGLLKDAGVTMRKQGLPDNRVAEAVARYEQGWTAPQIADHYGVSASNIRAILHREGVVMRDSRRRRRVKGFVPPEDLQQELEPQNPSGE